MSKIRFVDPGIIVSPGGESGGDSSISSSYALSASYASTASFLDGPVISASYALSASYAVSASYEIITEESSSFAETASYVNPLTQDVIVTGSINQSGSLIVRDNAGGAGFEVGEFTVSVQGDNVFSIGQLGTQDISMGGFGGKIEINSPVTASSDISGSATSTASFGTYLGDGSQLTGIIASKWTGSNPITRDSNVEITGSLNVSGSVDISIPSGSAFTVTETDKDQKGRLDFFFDDGDPTLEIEGRSATAKIVLSNNDGDTNNLKIQNDGQVYSSGVGPYTGSIKFLPNGIEAISTGTTSSPFIGSQTRPFYKYYMAQVGGQFLSLGTYSKQQFFLNSSATGTQRSDGLYNQSSGIRFVVSGSEVSGADGYLRNPNNVYLQIQDDSTGTGNDASIPFRVGKSGSLAINLNQSKGFGFTQYYTASAMVHVEAEPNYDLNLFQGNDVSGNNVFEVDRIGNISASGDLEVTNITASNNISASNNIFAKQLYIENNLAIDYDLTHDCISIGNASDCLNLLGTNITASSNLSSSATSTASFGTYLGDGSQLSGISTDPFPFVGDAQITGSLVISGSDAIDLTVNGGLKIISSSTNTLIGLTIENEGTPSSTEGYGAGIKMISGPGTSPTITGSIFVKDDSGGGSNPYHPALVLNSVGGGIYLKSEGSLQNSEMIRLSGGSSQRTNFTMYQVNGNMSHFNMVVNNGGNTSTRILMGQPTSGYYMQAGQGGSTYSFTIGTHTGNTGTFTPLTELNTDGYQVLTNITASGNISGSATSTASFGTYIGDGSQLTNLPASSAFPFTGDAQITGSLIVSGSFNAFRIQTNDVLLGDGAGNNTTVNANGNVMVGYQAGYTNTTGDKGVVIGYQAGYNLGTNASDANVLIGNEAGKGGGVTTGGYAYNVFLGTQAGYYMERGDENVGIGTSALRSNQDGHRNIAIGKSAISSTLGNDNIGIGRSAGGSQTTGTGNITIGSGSLGVAGESNQLRIGNGNSLVTISGSLETGDIIFPSTASAAYFVGDGSQLTNLPSTSPFPFTGDAQITGSLEISGSFIPQKDDNIIIGRGAASSLEVGGERNVVIGESSSRGLTTGDDNITIGYHAGRRDTNTESKNIFIGSYTGEFGDQNGSILIGHKNGQYGNGTSNVYIGDTTGKGHSGDTGTSNYNVFLGAGIASYYGLTNAVNNVAVGYQAGRYFTDNNGNTLVGYQAGHDLRYGNYNILIGHQNTGSDSNGFDNQLRIGNDTMHAISGSLTTGDLIFASTASAAYFVGDGSQLTNLPASDPFPFTGDAQITGSLTVSGSFLPHGNSATSNVVIGTTTGPSGGSNVIIGTSAGHATTNGGNVAIGANSTNGANTNFAVAIGQYATNSGTNAIAIGYSTAAGGNGIAIGRDAEASSNGIAIGKDITANTSQLEIGFETPIISASLSTGHVILSGSTGGLELIGSGSTMFEVIGSEGTLFSVDDDLSGTIFTANDISGLPILEASASGDVYIGKSPQSLYTTAVISSTTAATTQSIFGLSTSSYDGAFFDYTVQSGSDARAGSIMAVWNGGNISFTETTTTDIGNTTDFNLIVHISQSQAQIASHATNAGYKIKTIIRSI